jgi:CheY-like chemotaxis protein
MATVLLVDDVELFLELERSFLESGGHTVVTAASGEEALGRLEEVDPALVLLDLYMPGIDGDEVCRRLRASERWRHLPVIMVTAAGKDEEVRKCLAAGCDDYITKPVNKKELVEKVQRLLGKVKARATDRIPAALRVQLKSDGRHLRARAKDLSRNGIYVKSRTLLMPGTAVELILELPDGGVLPMAGMVKRAEEGAEGGMGIYFIRPEPQGLRILEDLLWQGLKNPARQAPGNPPDALPGSAAGQKAQLEEDNCRLHKRIAELEEENREFAEQLVHTEEVNNNLTNLYIASSRLHSVLNRRQVTAIIKEVVINFVGAEKFALLLFDKESKFLHYETGEGFEAEAFPPVNSGEGLLGEVVSSSKSYYREGSVTQGSDDPLLPMAAIPLQIHGKSMGVLAVYSLFTQKERFDPVDYQLFSMMAEHAATALFSSSLYEESERKRETYRGFMDLLLK